MFMHSLAAPGLSGLSQNKDFREHPRTQNVPKRYPKSKEYSQTSPEYSQTSRRKQKKAKLGAMCMCVCVCMCVCICICKAKEITKKEIKEYICICKAKLGAFGRSESFAEVRFFRV